MKKINSHTSLFLMLFALSCLFIFSCSSPKSSSKSELVQDISTDVLSESPLTLESPDSSEYVYACLLTGPELEQRKKEIQEELVQHMTGVKELPNGFMLSFSDKDQMEAKVIDFVMFERDCCPFFTFDVHMDPYHGGIELSITGNRLLKMFTRGMLKDLGLEV